MYFNELLKEKNITQYRLSKTSGVPQATISDICNGKVKIENCSAGTLYKIAKAMNLDMESLLEPSLLKRIDFDLFRSNICHELKELGDIKFIIQTLEDDDITLYFSNKWYPECLYLLAMLDYISKENNVPICDKYDYIRKYKLDSPVFPASINALAMTTDKKIKEKAIKESIPEFRRYNIIEKEVRNAV